MNALTPCGFCGTHTEPGTMLAGLAICEPCLIAEVLTYAQLKAVGAIDQALTYSPKAHA
jgi:hypothetical protein